MKKPIKNKPARTSIEQYNIEVAEAQRRVAKGKYKTQREVELLLDAVIKESVLNSTTRN